MSRNRNDLNNCESDHLIANLNHQNTVMRRELIRFHSDMAGIVKGIALEGDEKTLRAELTRVAHQIMDLSASIRSQVGEATWRQLQESIL